MGIVEDWLTIKLYHFTDMSNIPSIRLHNGLWPLCYLTNNKIDFKAGGSKESHERDRAKGYDRHVHLCMTTEHPMEYIARNDERRLDAVFLEIDNSVLAKRDILFSAGICYAHDVIPCPIHEAKGVDFDAIRRGKESTDALMVDRYRKVTKYELLIPSHISLRYIRNIPNG